VATSAITDGSYLFSANSRGDRVGSSARGYRPECGSRRDPAGASDCRKLGARRFDRYRTAIERDPRDAEFLQCAFDRQGRLPDQGRSLHDGTALRWSPRRAGPPAQCGSSLLPSLIGCPRRADTSSKNDNAAACPPSFSGMRHAAEYRLTHLKDDITGESPLISRPSI
jgi:hypothetical protein